MVATGQLHAPAALFPGKKLPVPIEQEVGSDPRGGLNVPGFYLCIFIQEMKKFAKTFDTDGFWVDI
jgi:hypothetical protein